jgi:glutathione synthase/RimK-type ligase-like ATP-grasp enzyme
MSILIVVNNPRDWPLHIPGVKVVPARTYLTDASYSDDRTAKVFNLCKSYRYQSVGYYVSLLAAARGHKPLPSISTIQDLKSQNVIRLLSEDLDELVQRTLGPIKEPNFTLSIYFGLNTEHRYNPLALRLFDLFQAPLLRAQFERHATWQLHSVRTIGANDIASDHHAFVVEAATKYFTGRNRRVRRRTAPRYDLAILHDPAETESPSNPKALQKFAKAAEAVGLDAEFITKDDFGRLAEFDALFIRETTRVNHHTYRFARRAAAEGLIVIDDPDSILRCTNKVYLAELLSRRGVPIPKTLLVHRDNVEDIVNVLGLPVVLKQPDSSFSQGVVKIETHEELMPAVSKLLDKSDLIVAQEYLPTTFDWRIGICDRRPLYVCKYFMAQRHWQIIKRDDAGKPSGEGNVQTLSVGETPREVIATALKAADMIGDGLYGVDLKQLGDRCYIIEINDNPSIDAGFEDQILKDALYREIMGVFLKRIEESKRGHVAHE